MDEPPSVQALDSARGAKPPAISPAWLGATAIAAIVYLAGATHFAWLCDDAFISFRYSRHLAESGGLFFNPGESPPVEGYSNLLWVLLMAPFARLGVPLELASRALSVAAGVALLAWLVHSAGRYVRLGFAGMLTTGVFFAALPTISIWATSGLETLPFALTVFALFERLLASESRAGSRLSWFTGPGPWVAAVVLLRADGALWAAVVLSSSQLARPGANLSLAWRNTRGVWACLALTVAAQLIFRLHYHGDLLPNTAYAKAGFSTLRLERGVQYVASYVATEPIAAIVPLAALAALQRSTAPLSLRCGTMVAFAVIWAAYVGGDFMPMGRLLAPMMAFLALLFALVLRRIASFRRAGAPAALAFALGAIGLAVLPSFDVHPVPQRWRDAVNFRWSSPERLTEYGQWRAMKQRLENWELIGRALALYARPGESIVFGAVGAVGYLTELVLLDPLGLVSREVARREAKPEPESPGHDLRVPPEFFIGRMPDYLGAFIVAPDVPLDAGVRPEWRAEAWFPRLEVERHPLRPEDGFPEGLELRLLRLHWKR